MLCPCFLSLCSQARSTELRLLLLSCPSPGIWPAGYPFPASFEGDPHVCFLSAASFLPWVHTRTIISSSKYHGLPRFPVHLIPGVPILLPYVCAGLMGSPPETASLMSERSWTLLTLPLALPTGGAPCRGPLSASGPSLEAITLHWELGWKWCGGWITRLHWRLSFLPGPLIPALHPTRLSSILRQDQHAGEGNGWMPLK